MIFKCDEVIDIFLLIRFLHAENVCAETASLKQNSIAETTQ